jgi:hypothetical protein
MRIVGTVVSLQCFILHIWIICVLPVKSVMYKVVQIRPGQTVTCLHTNNPSHIWTTLYQHKVKLKWK